MCVARAFFKFTVYLEKPRNDAMQAKGQISKARVSHGSISICLRQNVNVFFVCFY